MARSIEATVKPEMLTWGRESIGLSKEEAMEKLEKLGIKPDRLEEWEAGISRPTVAQLRKIAGLYKRPTAMFYLPEPPKEPDLPRDFRRTNRSAGPDYSPELRLELRKARYRRKVAIDLYSELYEDIPRFEETVSRDQDPEDLGIYIRGMLDVSIEEQCEWRDGYAALRQWKNAIEALGILVFQTSSTSRIPAKALRGVSIVEVLLPVILINSTDAVSARIFTLIHEFIHLLLHDGGVCDTEESPRPSTHEEKIELFCNHVAGATLVTAEDLLAQDVVRYKGGDKTWLDSELRRLANRFSVSREVILRRLLILGKTTRGFYEEKRAEFQRQLRKPPSSGGPEYYRIVMRNNGLAYTRLVIDAYYEGVVTGSKVSDYLGMKLKHLKKIEEAVMSMT